MGSRARRGAMKVAGESASHSCSESESDSRLKRGRLGGGEAIVLVSGGRKRELVRVSIVARSR
jgi:hypothetical protein